MDTEALARALHADLQQSPRTPLAQCLARFPGQEEDVARLWFARTEVPPRPAALTRAFGFGPYQPERELGQGSQGRVWLARDQRTGQPAAVKILSESPSNEARARLRRETETVSRLRHPALCNLLWADLDADPPYLATRFVPGVTLRAVLAETRAGLPATCAAARALCEPKSETALRAALRYFEQVARALHTAHEAGIVHRDLHPGNLMVQPAGTPVVLDFGVARLLEAATLTRTGQVLGTLGYAAPETRRGAPADRRADVFALATVLLECVTLAAPDADPQASLAQVPLQDLRTVLRRALAQDPRDRFATAALLADELRRIRALEPILTGTPSRLRQAMRAVRRHPLPVLAALALVAVLVTFAGLRARHLDRMARADASTALGREWLRRLADESIASLDNLDSLKVVAGADRPHGLDDQLLGAIALRLGRSLRRQGALDEARPHLDRALQLAPGVPAAVESVLLDLEQGGNPDQRLAAVPTGHPLARFVQAWRSADREPARETLVALADDLPAELGLQAAQTLLWALDLPRANRLLAALQLADHDPLTPAREAARGEALRLAGETAPALAILEPAQLALEASLGPRHPFTLRAKRALASVKGAAADRLSGLQHVTAVQLEVHGADHIEVAATRLMIAQCRQQLGTFAWARVDALEAQRIARAAGHAVLEAAASRALAELPDVAQPPAEPQVPPRAAKLFGAEQAAASQENTLWRRIDALTEAGRIAESAELWQHVFVSDLEQLRARAMVARELEGEASNRHLEALLELEWHGTRKGGQFGAEARDHLRSALRIALTHADQLDPRHVLRARYRFAALRVREQRELGQPADAELAELRAAVQEVVVRFGPAAPESNTAQLEQASVLADSSNAAEAAEAVPVYQALVAAGSGRNLEHQTWLAAAQINAGQLDAGAETLATIEAGLPKRGDWTPVSWLWDHVDSLRLRLEQLRARSAEKVGR